jgi:hypothetical protein
VHDELVLEVPGSELDLLRENLPKLMGGVAQLKVPLLVEVGVGATGTRRTEAVVYCPKPLYTVAVFLFRTPSCKTAATSTSACWAMCGRTGRASP